MHKAHSLPRDEFKREVEKHLTGRDTEPTEIVYFKFYKSQIPIIEQAIETADLMLGSDLCGLSGGCEPRCRKSRHALPLSLSIHITHTRSLPPSLFFPLSHYNALPGPLGPATRFLSFSLSFYLSLSSVTRQARGAPAAESLR